MKNEIKSTLLGKKCVRTCVCYFFFVSLHANSEEHGYISNSTAL